MKKSLLLFMVNLFVFLSNGQSWIENAGYGRQILLNENGRFGYAEKIWGQDIKNARLLIQYQYDWAGPFDDSGYAVVELNGKYGMIDTLGKTIIPNTYDYVYSFHNGYATVYQNGKFGAVDKKGKLVIPFEYDFLSSFTKAEKVDAVKGNRWGVINKENKVILPFQYLVAGTDDMGYSRVFSNNWIFFDPGGKQVLNETYQAMSKLDNGYIIGSLTSGKSILMDAGFVQILPSDLGYYSLHKTGNPCVVKKGTQYGLYDLLSKKMLLPAEYDYLHFDGDFVVVNNTKKTGYYYFTDLKGNKLFGKDFQAIREFDYTGFAQVKQNNKWGLIDRSGTFILPCLMGNDRESSINVDVNAGRISSHKKTGWGMTDLKGNIILPYQYAAPIGYVNPFYFSGEYKMEVVMDTLTKKEGIIDQKGNWIFAPGNTRYDQFGIINQFVKGDGVYVAVAKNGLWGVYDLSSKKEIISPQIKDNISAGLEYAHLKFLDKNDKWGLMIYNTGKIFTPGEYEYIDYDDETNFVTVEKNGLKGLQNLQGKLITEVTYSSLHYDSESGYYYAAKNGKCGFIDQNGKIIIPLKYDIEPLGAPNDFLNGHVRINYKTKSVLLDMKGKTIVTHSDFKGPDTTFIIRTRFSGNTWCYMAKYNDDNGKEVMKILLNGRLYENLEGDIYNSRPATDISFSEGLLGAKRDGLFGFLDKNGKEVIPFEYERVGPFESGVAFVKKEGKYFKINRNGQKLKYYDVKLAILAQDKK